MNEFSDAPHARPGDPATSHMAIPDKLAEQAYQVLLSYAWHFQEGLIDHDAYALAGFGPNARDGQRCSDLRRWNLIEWTGELGITPSKKSARKHRITPLGMMFLNKNKRSLLD